MPRSSSAAATLAPLTAAPASLRRRLWHWWQGQGATRQDRYAILAPLGAVVLFLGAVIASLAYLRAEELDREQQAAQRDAEYTLQRVRLRLVERQEQISLLARQTATHERDLRTFVARAESAVMQTPELQALTWVDARGRVTASHASAALPADALRARGTRLNGGDTESSLTIARDIRQPIYHQPQRGPLPPGAANPEPGSASPETPPPDSLLQLHVPMFEQGRYVGEILAEYSLDTLLRFTVPPEVAARYAVQFLDGHGHLVAGAPPVRKTARFWSGDPVQSESPVSPVGNGLVLRAQAYRTSQGVVGSSLIWLVGALSAMTAWMLYGTWRHTRRRQQAQLALVKETRFRRAMENSMLTGMRALDMQGRISYVNPAFCQMTLWNEDELVGRMPPYPYWPPEEHEALDSQLREELAGRVHHSGFQMRVQRKDGTQFDARLYVSPLVDPTGEQTGWMASMTDITEPNRIREQLSEAHERFTTVLEALDASVSVAPLGGSELLFANNQYRQWFGTEAEGHLQLLRDAGSVLHHSGPEQDFADSLAGLPSGALTDAAPDRTEIYVEKLDKWIEVRSRYLTWVDGRLAQMVIATDITKRRQAEEQADAQAERAQAASRLVTMGEMASSVAHELNQPLTAINNYCNGMVSRIRGGQIATQELLAPLEKTAHQAARAGQIIQRIRSFVKRSEPNRTQADVAVIVGEAVELAEIELRRRSIRFTQHVSPNLPTLLVDPILIEQVLINLLKNAAEAVDKAQRPPGQRSVELNVAESLVHEQDVVQFIVTDTGAGLAPEVMERLFEAFFSTKPEGMGIGLNLCRSIVESHRGRMQAENLYNGAEVAGCRFAFWIPVHATS